MKTAGILIDAWKLPIFKRHLEQAGYTFIGHLGPTPGCMTLKVATEFFGPLARVVEDANKECAKTGHPTPP